MPVTPPAKYWRQRYDLFEEWENGIFADFEAWYSTTPVLVARHQAVECIRKRKWQNAKPKRVVVLDAFCGVGGNTIAFAKAGFFVIACDIDSEKIKMAKCNSTVAKVDHRIEFICCDYLEMSSSARIDYIFLSPPWGGPSYTTMPRYTLSKVEICGVFGTELISRSLLTTKDVICFLPQTSDLDDISERCKSIFKTELHYVSTAQRIKAVTLYFAQQTLIR
ncbi:RNA cap guanine-N2 methyltransferase [Ostreococcus tauri]|uniref:Trimethylguanosine synthase n=1 Tax=Ostreococcus tauri TaxID=70448 RepID=A0A090MDI4_OSTTA|nr:RNA cap guanine-N2 methyltransferase [Ostreococcus tauri]CEG00981.1 RNA cap guanine-N2 methyltransferase [Ostreococcus tauri]|eukprot:XP_022840718.1 RNA cap guanine-N2 methyltransferase [Ostreococcus tauri]